MTIASCLSKILKVCYGMFFLTSWMILKRIIKSRIFWKRWNGRDLSRMRQEAIFLIGSFHVSKLNGIYSRYSRIYSRQDVFVFMYWCLFQIVAFASKSCLDSRTDAKTKEYLRDFAQNEHVYRIRRKVFFLDENIYYLFVFHSFMYLHI